MKCQNWSEFLVILLLYVIPAELIISKINLYIYGTYFQREGGGLNLQDHKITDHKISIAGKCRTLKMADLGTSMTANRPNDVV